MDRFTAQLQFILEIDKLKSILRRSYLVNSTRPENSAEHSWHLAMMAWLLAEHANEPVDVANVVKMVLIHDIVEIDAGDTFLYDTVGQQDKASREQQAATRIFGLLPEDQAAEIFALWREFEARQTADSRFANALDRFIPLLHNYYNEGRPWRSHGVTSDQIFPRLAHMGEGSTTLWQYAQSLIADAVTRGYLPV